ncbi:hypothetical protein WJX77_008758 [Trebouxia sp. C0004]
METPVKRRPEHVDRNVATPNSARHSRPWRGVAPSHNSKPDVTLPARTPRKPAQHIARALGASSLVSATPRPKGSPTHSPPDSPRSTGDFSTFSDGDWEENLADNVKVITRIRPPSQMETDAGGEGAERCVAQSGARGVAVSTQRAAQPYEFAYDHVSGELGSQDDLFMLAGHPIVENFLAGYNSSIFAYGQTGAGKTYTMIGQLGRSDQRGLAPRVFEYIFKRISEEEDNGGRDQVQYSVKCSFLEIYNETITDLLKPSSGNLNLREDMKRGCYVDNLTEQVVLNVEDALNVMRKGTENRRIGETNMNRESSRSHSVFTCIMESSTKGAEDGCNRVKFSRLNLVDLAGSERNKLSGATGEHFKEACSINKSLTCLGRVIMELVEAQRQGRRHIHIPYRDSRLTFLLQDSLGGNAKTMIIANVSPCRMCAQETLSTLQFASRAKHIRNKAVINQDTNGDVAMLQREVMRLRRELNLVRDECTEPVVRENLELQERLVAHQQTKADLEDRLAATRSEVRKHKEHAEWAEKKYAELESQRKELEDSQQSSHKEQVDALWSRLEAASEAHKQQVQQLQEKQQQELVMQLEQRDAACSQVQQQLEAQQAQHAAHMEDMSSKAVQMESLIRQGTELDLQHVAELHAREAELDELRQRMADVQQQLAESQSGNAQLQTEEAQLQQCLASQQSDFASVSLRLEEEQRIRNDAQTQLQTVTQQLQEQQQTAADQAAMLEAEVSQLQQQQQITQTEAEETHAAAKLRQIEHEGQAQALAQELEHVKQCLAVEKQSNGELTEAIRKQRRAAAQQDAEAAGREHKHQDEVQQLRKALAVVQQDLEGKKEELQQEVVRSTKYKNVHLKIQDAISEVSDCMTPAGSSRYRVSHGSVYSLRPKQHPWDLLPESPTRTGLIAAGSFQPNSADSEAGEHDSELQGDSESSNTENTAPGQLEAPGSASKGSWVSSPKQSFRAEDRRAEGRRASTGSSASLTRSGSVKSKLHSRQPPHVQITVADMAGFSPLSPNNR